MLSRRLVRTGLACLPLLMMLLAAAAAVSRPAQEPVTVTWRTDYELARREAKQTGKPLLVVFRCER